MVEFRAGGIRLPGWEACVMRVSSRGRDYAGRTVRKRAAIEAIMSRNPTGIQSSPSSSFIECAFLSLSGHASEVWCGRKDSNLHGIATASPSSWCVCQFRHFRDWWLVDLLAPPKLQRRREGRPLPRVAARGSCVTSAASVRAPVLVPEPQPAAPVRASPEPSMPDAAATVRRPPTRARPGPQYRCTARR